MLLLALRKDLILRSGLQAASRRTHGAKPAPHAQPGSIGVGQLNAAKLPDVTGTPPNPNLALNSFVVSGSGGVSFDAASWAAMVAGNASWADASWAVTEPGIYYQSAYVRLLSAFVK